MLPATENHGAPLAPTPPRGMGRLAHFAGFYLALQIFGLFVAATLPAAPSPDSELVSFALPMMASIAVYFLVVAILHTFRFKDLGRPKWHVLLLLVPFYNLYLGYLLFFRKGTARPGKASHATLVAAGLVALASNALTMASGMQVLGILPGARVIETEFVGTHEASAGAFSAKIAKLRELATGEIIMEGLSDEDAAAGTLREGDRVELRRSSLGFSIDQGSRLSEGTRKFGLFFGSAFLLLDAFLLALGLRGLRRAKLSARGVS